ncbi:DNA/RNA helicase domain-containing protein [Pedobacter suwonensis]|uniref:DNA/RNA helicase domain-containing protein n=1 Tax=Pedobacter suwonensis TaxID=332999 RepID=UPI001C969EED|nr:DNA/RNA helicase domain-containing protein [Pedobacter suwonensis]
MAFELSIDVSEFHDFNKQGLIKIQQNPWVRNQWPVVYFIRNDAKAEAYVGESTNAASRIANHLANPVKASIFNQISIIGCDKFNKSVTLDIESNLIRYISSEGTYKLKNGNDGLIVRNYYQRELYKDLFKEVWKKLIDKKIISKSLKEVENSDLFKYSPYTSLNKDQYASVLDILTNLDKYDSTRIFIKGSAGTGKTVLATYLIKLLATDITNASVDEFNEDEIREVNYIKSFQLKYPNAKIGLVIAMSSLRKTLQRVFSQVPGLKSSMVIGPSDTFKSNEKYDLLIVDEAHRLRQYKNIGWRGTFKKNNQKLGLDNSGNELDWIMANSKNQIFFYDKAQSVKPSDIPETFFSRLLDDQKTIKLELHSQMRVMGGNDYIQFVDDLMNVKLDKKAVYQSSDYQLLYFDSLAELYRELGKKEQEHGLCRMVAGYSWPYKSEDDKTAIDIELDGLSFQWNQVTTDWVNSPNAFKEIGCIHTTQGYDLNYTGLIFGKEIDYNIGTGKIEVNRDEYFDGYGKIGVDDDEDLKEFLVNIYKTVFYRGIRGSFIYACNPNLAAYLKKHIPLFEKEPALKIIPFEKVKPYENAVPLLDIRAAAGNFSDLQIHSDFEWVELPFNIIPKKDYFVCRVVGESMNKWIPNGAYCLFRQDGGGSRNGKIVLVQSTAIQDADFGSGYTVKEYHSKKVVTDEGWQHNAISLKPLSDDLSYEAIELAEDELTDFKVVGVFERVLA